jgi:hypothetical protein
MAVALSAAFSFVCPNAEDAKTTNNTATSFFIVL